MKRLVFTILFGIGISWCLQAQPIYYAPNASIAFFSEALLEDISAESDKAVAFWNTETGEIRFKVPIESFVFPNALMQQHFNEQYLESDKYPHAEFKGFVNEQQTEAAGTLSLHGREKEYKTPISLQKQGEGYLGQTSFMVKLEDHRIKIPKLMWQKIAEEIKVTIAVHFLPYQTKQG